MYKYERLKKQKETPHPDDINRVYELKAQKLGSKNLENYLIKIRNEKIYTGKDPGSIVSNFMTGDFLCYIEAYNGIIRQIRWCDEILFDKSVQLPKQTLEIYKNGELWSDKYTKIIPCKIMRNPNVDWEHLNKEKKICVETKEKENQNQKESNKQIT